ncbi:MAG: response regulator [Magnetococcales bacterium]|nr:response regulator [Magnetococcales bacterium]
MIEIENTQLRILIVEDESIIGLDLSFSLETLGHEVVGVVAEGKQAIVVAEAMRPDLIFMDIGLRGEMDGVEAAAAILAVRPTPVVFLSGYSDRDVAGMHANDQNTQFLAKPIDESRLSEVVEWAVKRSHSG